MIDGCVYDSKVIRHRRIPLPRVCSMDLGLLIHLFIKIKTLFILELHTTDSNVSRGLPPSRLTASPPFLTHFLAIFPK
jgi:hypothetical protein